MFSVKITSDVASLLAESDQWNELSRGIPFRETSWLAPWWRHLGGDSEAYIVVVRDENNRLRGLLPLYRPEGDARGQTLAIMGDGMACSDHCSVLAQASEVEPIARAIGEHLALTAKCPQWGWEILDFDGIVEGDPGMTALAQGLNMGGATLHASSRVRVWYKPADASWEHHLGCYGKTQRRKMRRWSEKIGDNAPFRQYAAETSDQATQMIDALIAMHQRRWEDVGEKGSFASPRFRHFIHETAQDFLRRGQLYVTALEHKDQIVAAELSFLGANQILYVYSAGFDTAHAELEPGRILSTDTLRHLYRARLSGIDYMRGDEEYKKRYTTESRRLIRLRAVAPNLLPRLKHAAWSTGFEFKQWVRRKTGRPPITVLDMSNAQTPGLIPWIPSAGPSH